MFHFWGEPPHCLPDWLYQFTFPPTGWEGFPLKRDIICRQFHKRKQKLCEIHPGSGKQLQNSPQSSWHQAPWSHHHASIQTNSQTLLLTTPPKKRQREYGTSKYRDNTFSKTRKSSSTFKQEKAALNNFEFSLHPNCNSSDEKTNQWWHITFVKWHHPSLYQMKKSHLTLDAGHSTLS